MPRTGIVSVQLEHVYSLQRPVLTAPEIIPGLLQLQRRRAAILGGMGKVVVKIAFPELDCLP